MRRCRPALGTFVEIRIVRLGGMAAVTGATMDAEDAGAELARAVDAGAAATSAVGADAVACDASDADAPAIAAIAAIDAAFTAVARVDALMSFHRPTSDLSRLNRAAAGERLVLDPWTVEVLALAAELHHATGGLFDCAVGAELIAAGLLPGDRPAAGSGSIADLEIVDATQVRVLRPMCLDLGGIAKGAAVDRAIAALRMHGVVQASVDAGGDLRVLGPEAEPVRLRSPTDRARTVEIGTLADGAIATSSGGFVGDRRDRRWRSPLIDPRSREAVVDRRSFSVLADRCAVADGLTKALAVTGQLPAACLARYGATALVL